MEKLAELSQTIPSANGHPNWLLRTWYWLVTLLLITAVLMLALWTQHTITTTVERQIMDRLTSTLEASHHSARVWFEAQQTIAAQFVDQRDIHEQLVQILSDLRDAETIRSEPLQLTPSMADALQVTLKHLQASDYMLFDPTGLCLASSDGNMVGQHCPARWAEYFESVARGKMVMIPPQQYEASGVEQANQRRVLDPNIYLISPLKDSQQRVVGSVAFAADAASSFRRLFPSQNQVQWGETYAASADAIMLSPSIYEAQVRAMELLDATLPVPLNLPIIDPGLQPRSQSAHLPSSGDKPLTLAAAEMALAAAESDSSIRIQAKPYRNYCGIEVVGGVRWLPEYSFGLITEISHEQAYAATRELQTGLWSFLALLAIAFFGFLFEAKLSRKVLNRLKRTERKLEKMGQYELLEKIGQGGMGEVYRAHHSTLRRETAVKICRTGPDDTTATIRFQREVQAASQLNNPHTVRIFDYGRSPDGTFYYAMELLHGLNLSSLVRQFGPLSDGRTVMILKQICESLSEAHGLGLVHRDIKPSNVMISRRGGRADYVKVLDFGLVRSIANSETVTLTVDGCVAGTPQYMSPESSQSPDEVDPRSDLYSLGCVAYFLLTGQPPFLGSNPLEICLKQVREQPKALSEVSSSPIAQSLSQAVMRCLAKSPGHRPQSAMELLSELESVLPLSPWSRAEAEFWWRENASTAQSLMVSGPDTQVTLNPATPQTVHHP